MKLSDAIMLGSALLKRGDYSGHDENVGCVLQMALMAIGAPRTIVACSQSSREWKWLNKAPVICPDCGGVSSFGIHHIIAVHLNDWHKWPIEKIADWVRSVEPQEPQPTAEPQAFTEQMEETYLDSRSNT